MSTSRKQITTYLPPDLVQALETWQRDRGIPSISAAVVAILQEYLQGRSATPGMVEVVEAVVDSRLAGVRAELDQLKHQVDLLALTLAPPGYGSGPQGSGRTSPEIRADTGEYNTAALHPHFQPGDWVRYYFKGRNLIEQVLEVYPTETGIDQLLLPSGYSGAQGPELDLFPATMVTPYTPEEATD